MGGVTHPVPSPALALDGAMVPELTRQIESLVVHSLGDESTAEIRLVDVQLAQVRRSANSPRVEVWLADEALFAGRLTQTSWVLPEGSAPHLILNAAGVAQDGPNEKAVHLRAGMEIVSCAVRRGATRITARGVTTVSALRCGSEVRLTTLDPAFDGRFEIKELWHRFDATRGLRVEFAATGLRFA